MSPQKSLAVLATVFGVVTLRPFGVCNLLLGVLSLLCCCALALGQR